MCNEMTKQIVGRSKFVKYALSREGIYVYLWLIHVEV